MHRKRLQRVRSPTADYVSKTSSAVTLEVGDALCLHSLDPFVSRFQHFADKFARSFRFTATTPVVEVMSMNSHLSNGDAHESGTSWTQILRENSSWIRKILRNRLANHDEVEEVFQDIGLSIAQTDLKPEEVENPSAWLYRVVIRQVLQYRRKSGRYRKLVRNQIEKSSRDADAGPDPLALLMRTERTEAIRSILQTLSDLDREILMLKYSENWTYQQLADKLGVSTNTIEHRLVKSKKQLRKLLANKDGEVTV